MTDYDLIISGAGPAGSNAAFYAKKNGLNVLLIDKAVFPRDKPCGGALSINVCKRYSLEELIDISSTDACFKSSKGIIANDVSDEVHSGFVKRIVFDNALLERAKNAGVKVNEGEVVNDYELRNDSIIIHSSKKDYSSKFLIGADGAISRLRMNSGLTYPKKYLGLSYVIEVNVASEILDEYFSTHRRTNFDLFSFGYGWIFPKKDSINIGYGGLINKIPKGTNYFIEYINSLKSEKRIPEINDYSIKAGFIPMGFVKHATCLDRLLFAGDAAGFVNPISGGGIDYALISGELAANTVSKALSDGEYSKEYLSSVYDKAWKKEFGKGMNINLLIQKLMLSHNELPIKIARKKPHIIKLIQKLMTNEITPLKMIYESSKTLLKKK